MKTKARYEFKVFVAEVVCAYADMKELRQLKKVLRKKAWMSPDLMKRLFVLKDMNERNEILLSDNSTLWTGNVSINEIHRLLVKEGYEQTVLNNPPEKIKWKTCIGYSLESKS